MLAVGPCDSTGRLRSYAMWSAAIDKPDLFMDDQLQGTALQVALKAGAVKLDDDPLGPGTQGSSFAALHAVAAAILVWATWPELTPQKLRAVLLAACVAAKGPHTKARVLTLPAALARARLDLVRNTLRDGPCALMSLAAITGLAPADVDTALEALMKSGDVRRLTRGRLERYARVDAE